RPCRAPRGSSRSRRHLSTARPRRSRPQPGSTASWLHEGVIYAVVLAAGASSRYGDSPPKQQVLLPRVLAALEQSRVDGVVVVGGAHPLDVETVHCPDWERGPGASLRCGLAALPAAAEAAVVLLADGPDLDPRAVDRVVDAWRQDGGDVVAASY